MTAEIFGPPTLAQYLDQLRKAFEDAKFFNWHLGDPEEWVSASRPYMWERLAPRQREKFHA
jgi:hypothetical protein